MAKSLPNQYSFASGELSPLMGGRSDLEIYSSGVATLKNMYSDSRGPARNREAMKLVIDLVAGTKAKVETYNRNKNEFFTFVFTNLELRFIRNIESPTVELFVAPWTTDQVDDVYVVPLPDGRTFYLLHSDVPPYKLVDNVGSLVTTTITASGNFVVPAGVTELSVCVCGGGGAGGGSNSQPTFNGGGGGGSGVVRDSAVVVTPAEVIPVVIGAGGVGIAGGGTFADGPAGGDSSFTPTSTVVSSLGGGGGGGGYSGISGDGHAGSGSSGGGNGGVGSNGAVDSADGSVCSAVCGGNSWVGGIAANVNGGGGGGGGGYGVGADGAVSSDQAGGDAVVNTGAGGGGALGVSTPVKGGDGGSGIVVVTYATPSAGLSLSIVSFTSAPIDWSGTNWPSVGAYYQSRLWLGGTPDKAETFLGSQNGLPENFDLGTGLDAEAMSFALENFGGIEWMMGTKNLLIGTINGEYIVKSTGGAITTSDIQVEQQSSYGSASIQPVKIGDQVIYVTPDRRKIRAMNFEERKNNWMSTDLTLPSEHLTSGLIKDLSWSQHPNNLLWATLEDGTMVCLSYERGDNIKGWHRHDTQGIILGTGSGFDGIRDVLVLAVMRTTSQIEINILHEDYYFDSWKQTSSITDLGGGLYSIVGFDHLNGKTVQIVIDGAIHSDRIVGAESSLGAGDSVIGQIFLESTGTVVVVGLGYTPELETLDLDGGSVSGTGSSTMKRRNKIYVKVLESGLPLINGARGNDRLASTPMGSADPPISGAIEVVGSHWDRVAVVNVQQDLPLPLVILSIFGEVTKNSL